MQYVSVNTILLLGKIHSKILGILKEACFVIVVKLKFIKYITLIKKIA